MRFWNNAWRNVLAVILGLAFVALFFGGAELALRIRAWHAAPADGKVECSDLSAIVAPHPLLGFQGKPASAARETRTRNGEIIYSVVYHLGADSRRITPVENVGERRHTALFTGCSFTFGAGVEDGETLPAQFANYAPAYYPVNAGFMGYGLQHVWLLLNDNALMSALPHDRGVVVYPFIDHHINRLTGAPDVLINWSHAMPWLDERQGRIVYCGTFFDRNPLQYVLNRYCRRLHVYRFMEKNMATPAPPNRVDSAMLDFAAKVIVDAAEKLHATHPGFRFCMLAFPDAVHGRDMIHRLQDTPVKCLDYTELLADAGLPKEALWHKDIGAGAFGHPKAAALDIIARQLARDLAPRETPASQEPPGV